jgi:hypothetical protein
VLPSNVLSNTRASHDEIQPENIRWIYIVSHNAVLKALINIFSRLYRRFGQDNLTMLETLQAAYDDIKARRAAPDSSETPAPTA